MSPFLTGNLSCYLSKTEVSYANQFHRRCGNRYLKEIKAQIYKVDLLKSKDKFGYNAVGIAVLRNYYDCLSLILQYVIERKEAYDILTQKDSDGFSPLDIAINFQYKEIANLLRQYIEKASELKEFNGWTCNSS